MCSWFLMAPILVFIYMTILFVLAQYKKDNSIADIGWAGGFILLAISSYFLSQLFTARSTLVTILIILWATRLTWHIWSRHKGEDKRYQKLRQTWGDYIYVNAFLYVFMLQGLFMLLIAYPIVLINTTNAITPFSFIDYGALVLWIGGFLFEVVGDYQLSKFLENPENKGNICDIGLWRYTRHPNYFGESCMWSAMFLFALPIDYGWTTIISPLTITAIFFWFSIPMTEEQLVDNSAYKKYQNKTSKFFPWISKD